MPRLLPSLFALALLTGAGSPASAKSDSSTKKQAKSSRDRLKKSGHDRHGDKKSPQRAGREATSVRAKREHDDAPIKARSDGSTAAPPRDAEAAAAASSDPQLATLRDQLAGMLHEKPLSRSRVGVEVMTASDGKVLFAYNDDRLFNPASNTKILTTAAALSELGPEYRYPTQLVGPAPDDDGVVHGDVELRGSGDPSLTTGDLAEIARKVAESGVTKIDGSLITDGRFRDQSGHSVGEQAIILNRNTYTIRVRPTSPGHEATIEVEPETDYFTAHSKVTTVAGKKRTRLGVDVSREDGRLRVTVRGRINERADAVIRKRVGDSSQFAAALLKRALVDFGVEVTGGVHPGTLAADAPTLATHESAPLSVICRVSNKDSNNFVADTIFKTLGGLRYGWPGTFAKGQQAVRDLLAPLGYKPEQYRIINGSGLTHENRIAPSSLAKLLRHLYFDLTVAPEFLTSLAVGGIDGTIRGRFLGTDAVGLVRAKTGTLSGVSALSGYVGEKSDVLIFSIFVEGFRHSRLQAIRSAQVRMVLAMLKYLKAAHPNATTVVPAEGEAVTPPPAQQDFEDDGDDTTSITEPAQ